MNVDLYLPQHLTIKSSPEADWLARNIREERLSLKCNHGPPSIGLRRKPVRRTKSNMDGVRSSSSSSKKISVARQHSFDPSCGPNIKKLPKRGELQKETSARLRVGLSERQQRTTGRLSLSSTPAARRVSERQQNTIEVAQVSSSSTQKKQNKRKGNRKPLQRSKTQIEDVTTVSNNTASKASLRKQGLRRSSTLPKKQHSCQSKLQVMKASAATKPKSSKYGAAGTKQEDKKKRIVQFGETQHLPYEPHALDTISTFWYSKKDLKMLMDHEVQISMRCKPGTSNLHCCSRGIEHLVAGEDKALKIKRYIQTILMHQSSLLGQKRSSTCNDDQKSYPKTKISLSQINAAAAAKELRSRSQSLSKEDRKRAYRQGLMDASDEGATC